MSDSSAVSPTRRQFLRCSAGALATSLVAGGLDRSAAAGQFTGKIQKAVKFHMVEGQDLSILDKFKLVRELGFDGIEIRTAGKVVTAAALAARDATGLPIHGVINSDSPFIREAIDLAKTFGGTSVLIVAGRVRKDSSYDDNYRVWSARLKEHAPYAEQQGIRLLVENVWNNFLLSPLEMVRFIDEIESPAVGVYFDVGNVVRYGFPEQWIRILGQRIGKLDIKEYSRTIEQDEGVRKGFRVEIGDGDVDYPAVRQALAEIAYTGWATAEVPGGGSERLAEIARRMDVALDLV